MNETLNDIHTQEERERIMALLNEIPDPEIPVLSVIDLGIIRDVIFPLFTKGEKRPVEILITPTYSGCPAMDMIRLNIRMLLLSRGYEPVKVTEVLFPPWTTEWMTEEGRNKLSAYGIAPPLPSRQTCQPGMFEKEEAVSCPRCQSFHTHRVSEFGSTPCKSLYQCDDCHEPFDYFKCH